MNKYALFGGQSFYPAGGFDDFIVAGDNIEKLKSAAMEARTGNYNQSLGWADIVNLQTMERILSLDGVAWVENRDKPALDFACRF